VTAIWEKNGGGAQVVTYQSGERQHTMRRGGVQCTLLIDAELSASNGRGGSSGTQHSGHAMTASRVLMALDGSGGRLR
jgi:hypothetical protein